MAKVLWTEWALNDVERIADYIAQDSLPRAARVTSRIFLATRRLEHFPNIGAVVPEFGRQDLREIASHPYRLVYRLRGDTCQILAILHASRGSIVDRLTGRLEPPDE